MPNMVFEIVEDLFIVVHRVKPPTDEEWTEYLDSWRPRDMAAMRTLVFTDGGGPNTSQRRNANEILAGRASLTAVVSSSPMVRGIVTSLSWFNPKIRAFQPELAVEAFRYLGAHTPEAVAELWGHADRLRERLGDATLKSIPPRAA